MNYWTKQKEFKKGHFDVKVSTSPEFMPVGDLFDDTCSTSRRRNRRSTGEMLYGFRPRQSSSLTDT